jgi:hypothetical protein
MQKVGAVMSSGRKLSSCRGNCEDPEMRMDRKRELKEAERSSQSREDRSADEARGGGKSRKRTAAGGRPRTLGCAGGAVGSVWLRYERPGPRCGRQGVRCGQQKPRRGWL